MTKGFVRGGKSSKVASNGASKPTQKKGLQKVGGGNNTKVECPITYEHFSDNATPLVLSVDGQDDVTVTSREGEDLGLSLSPVEYSTGTLGYMLNGNAVLNIGGEEVPVIVDFKVYVVGSKSLPR
jgi:hypothetical protein